MAFPPHPTPQKKERKEKENLASRSLLGPCWEIQRLKGKRKTENIPTSGSAFFCLFAISRATPRACGGSQARGPIRAVATGLQ